MSRTPLVPAVEALMVACRDRLGSLETEYAGREDAGAADPELARLQSAVVAYAHVIQALRGFLEEERMGRANLARLAERLDDEAARLEDEVGAGASPSASDLRSLALQARSERP
jgi:hypothetical protein